MERLNLNAGWYAHLINFIIADILSSEHDDEEALLEEIEQRHPDALQLDGNVLKHMLNESHPEM
jgi:hypothetical protein